MLNNKDIHAAIKVLSENERCDSVMSATKYAFPIQRAVYENDESYAVMFEPKNYSSRSQDLIEAKHDAGQFYLTRAASVRNGSVLTNLNVRLQLLHRNNVVDIDTNEDFEIAEERLRINKNMPFDKNWTF